MSKRKLLSAFAVLLVLSLAACGPAPTEVPAPVDEVAAGEEAGAEGGLEVVPADRPIQIEDFTGQEQLRNDAAAHGARIDFIQRHASRRDLGLVEPQGSAEGQRGRLDRPSYPGTFLTAELGQRAWEGDVGLEEQGICQPSRERFCQHGSHPSPAALRGRFPP